MRSDDLAVRQARVEALIRQHHATVEWHAVDMYALAETRHIVARRPIDDATEAGILHELGHIVNGVCPRTGSHDQVVYGGSNLCLECERSAWSTAMRLVPFNGGMYRRLQYCLSTYRRSPITPRPMAAARAADDLMNFVTGYAKPRQQKVETEWRRELVTAWKQETTVNQMSLATARAMLARAK